MSFQITILQQFQNFMLRRRKNLRVNKNISRPANNFKQRQFSLPILKTMNTKPCFDIKFVIGTDIQKNYQQSSKKLSKQIQNFKYTKPNKEDEENTCRKYTYKSTKYADLFSERIVDKQNSLQRLQKNIKSHLNSVQASRTPFLITKRQKQVIKYHEKYFLKLLTKDDLLRDKVQEHIIYGIESFKKLKNIILCPNHFAFEPKKLPPTNKKTLILDLDQTLIHTSEERHPEHVLTTKLRAKNRQYDAFVTFRPHAKQFLKNLHQSYQIIIFTAAIESYANPIIDELDPDNLIKYRFFRDSCTLVQNQYYIKDLRIFGRQLKDMLIVDNSPYTYFLQPENGVPIIPFENDMADAQLLSLEKYLLEIVQKEDLKEINAEIFQLKEYSKYHSVKSLIFNLYKIEF